MDDNGFIVIHRKMQKWEWYDDLNMCGFFLHLLLLANWEDRRWHGILIKRGSFITSYRKLADSMKTSTVTIYKWIKRLTETGEITVSSTRKYTVISIVSYDFYQSKKTEKETLKKHKGNTEETLSKHRLYTTEQYYNNNNNNNNKNNSLSLREGENEKREREIFSEEVVAEWAKEFDDPEHKINPAGHVLYVESHGGDKSKVSFDSYCVNQLHLQKIENKKQEEEAPKEKTPEQIRQEKIEKWRKTFE